MEEKKEMGAKEVDPGKLGDEMPARAESAFGLKAGPPPAPLPKGEVFAAVNRVFGEGPDVQAISRHALLNDLVAVADRAQAAAGGPQCEGKAIEKDPMSLAKEYAWERDEALRSAKAWQETANQHARNEEFYRGIVRQAGHALCDQRVFTSDDGSKQDEPLALKVPGLVLALAFEVRELRGFKAGAMLAKEVVDLDRAQNEWDILVNQMLHDLGARDGDRPLGAVRRVVDVLKRIQHLVSKKGVEMHGTENVLDYIRQEITRLELRED